MPAVGAFHEIEMRGKEGQRVPHCTACPTAQGLHRASPCEGILEGSGILGNSLLAVARGLREFCSASLQLRSSNSAITRSQAQENVHPAPARRPTCTFVSGLPAQKSDQVVIEAQHAPPPRPGLALPLVLRPPPRLALPRPPLPQPPLPRALPAWRPRARRRQRVWAGSSRRSRPAPGARRSPLQKKRRALREPQDYGGASRRVRGFAFGLRAEREGGWVRESRSGGSGAPRWLGTAAGIRPRSCGCQRRLRGYSLRLRTRKAEAAARALGACPGSLAAHRLRPPFPARYVPIPRGSLRSRTFYFGDAPGRCVRLFPSAARSLERFCLRGCALRLCFCR